MADATGRKRPTATARACWDVRFARRGHAKGGECDANSCLLRRRGVLGLAGTSDADGARGERDTHITDQPGLTIDCNNGTLFVNGSLNVINATGVCYAVTMQGSDNTVIADTITDDITVYGNNQTVMFHNGDPYILDRGRELGMTNSINRA